MKITSTLAAAIVAAALGVAIAAPAHAAVFNLNTDPFAGSDALTQSGRQIVGGEPFIEFSIATDVFLINPAFFDAGNEINFISALTGDLPTGGVNVIVVQDTPAVFAAGTAATLIAEQIETDGAGFFVYFNTTFDAPRLVYSTNLNDDGADLKILARMTNLGPESLPEFTAANFAMVPEPSSLLLMMAAGAMLAGAQAVRRRA